MSLTTGSGRLKRRIGTRSWPHMAATRKCAGGSRVYVPSEAPNAEKSGPLNTALGSWHFLLDYEVRGCHACLLAASPSLVPVIR